MADSIAAGVHRATTWSIALSVLLILTGVAAIAAPFIAGLAITAVVGWLLLVSAALHIAFAFRAWRAGTVVWQILLGLVYGFIGYYILRSPAAGLAGLTFAIGAYLFAEAVLEFVLAAQIGSVSGRGWLIADGVITLLLAVMIAATWPSSSAWVVGTLIGISMLFSGW